MAVRLQEIGWASEDWSMNNVSLRTLAKGVRRMKGKRRTPEEKIRILRQADGERTILENCAENNISEQTFHRWKKEFACSELVNESETLFRYG